MPKYRHAAEKVRLPGTARRQAQKVCAYQCGNKESLRPLSQFTDTLHGCCRPAILNKVYGARDTKAAAGSDCTVNGSYFQYFAIAESTLIITVILPYRDCNR